MRIPTHEGATPHVLLSDMRFEGPDPYDGGRMTAELHGEDLEVRCGVFLYAFESIDGFFRDLADHWRGWDGAKTWQSPETHLSIEATAVAGGHRLLRFSLRNHPLPSWGAWVEVDIEGGEEMTRLAADITALISSAAR